jgi:hypothetical protein
MMMPSLHAYLIMAVFVLILSTIIIAAQDTPGYTDAYYYYNVGAKLADGEGLTDAYLWMYINAPDKLPTESHRYWMPLASLVAALPMLIFGTGFDVAQWGFVPFLVGLAWIGMALGMRIGGSRRQMWVAGFSVVLGGFYLPFWLTTDTFAVFGLVGAGALIALGIGRDWRWYALGGALSGLAHLARADGLLLVIVGLIVIWLPIVSHPKRWRVGTGFTLSADAIQKTAALILAYLLVMLPWFLRSMDVLGSPLPAGGIETAYLHGYNDLFSYPAGWNLQHLMDWGWGNVLKSRWDGLLIAFQTWLAVEGLIVLAPFALYALWKRRQERFFVPMIWYAIGLHLAMSVVFTYPGSRGGLFHSSAALFPFWVALGLAGVDDFIGWLALKRRWRKGEAQIVFGVAVLLLPMALGYTAWSAQTRNRDDQPDYETITALLPEHARLMTSDPAAWNYHTGLMGVTLPEESLETSLKIAQRYCITHLVIDKNVTDAFQPLIEGTAEPPPFLNQVHHFDGNTPDDWSDDVRLYVFAITCTP